MSTEPAYTLLLIVIIERDIGKVGEIIELTRGKGLILSIDSNSRSKLWHNTYTNHQGKTLEEFIITSDLLLVNEAQAFLLSKPLEDVVGLI